MRARASESKAKQNSYHCRYVICPSHWKNRPGHPNRNISYSAQIILVFLPSYFFSSFAYIRLFVFDDIKALVYATISKSRQQR